LGCVTTTTEPTDRSHVDDLVAQRADTEQLLERRRAHYRERAGRELTDDNIWIRERHRELASLDAIIAKLREQPAANSGAGAAAAGAGTANRLPSLSPVSMTTSTPRSCSAATAVAAVGRGASASAISPAGRPSTATSTVVRPAPASSSRRAANSPGSTLSRSRRRWFPTATRRPATLAIAP
jgi:hypothetical protein